MDISSSVEFPSTCSLASRHVPFFTASSVSPVNATGDRSIPEGRNAALGFQSLSASLSTPIFSLELFWKVQREPSGLLDPAVAFFDGPVSIEFERGG